MKLLLGHQPHRRQDPCRIDGAGYGRLQIPHQDGSGVIDIVGANVDPARIGERVWIMLSAFDNVYGTAADYVIVDVANVRCRRTRISNSGQRSAFPR